MITAYSSVADLQTPFARAELFLFLSKKAWKSQIEPSEVSSFIASQKASEASLPMIQKKFAQDEKLCAFHKKSDLQAFIYQLDLVFQKNLQEHLFNVLQGPQRLIFLLLPPNHQKGLKKDLKNYLRTYRALTRIRENQFIPSPHTHARIRSEEILRSFDHWYKEKKSYIRINSKRLELPNYEPGESDKWNKRVFAKALIQRLEKCLQDQSYPLDMQVEVLLRDWSFRHHEQEIQRKLKKRTLNEKTIKKLESTLFPNALGMSISSFIDWTRDWTNKTLTAEVLSQALVHVPFWESIEKIRTYPILQCLSFGAASGGIQVMRDTAFPKLRKHFQLVKSDRSPRYQIGIHNPIFQITHFIPYLIKDREDRIVARIELLWTLHGKIGEELKPSATLSFDALKFKTRDMEQIRELIRALRD